MVVVAPRANSSYEGKQLQVEVEFSGPVDERSNKLYFEYTGNPNVSNILPKRQLVTLVTVSENRFTVLFVMCLYEVSSDSFEPDYLPLIL